MLIVQNFNNLTIFPKTFSAQIAGFPKTFSAQIAGFPKKIASSSVES